MVVCNPIYHVADKTLGSHTSKILQLKSETIHTQKINRIVYIFSIFILHPEAFSLYYIGHYCLPFIVCIVQCQCLFVCWVFFLRIFVLFSVDQCWHPHHLAKSCCSDISNELDMKSKIKIDAYIFVLFYKFNFEFR